MAVSVSVVTNSVPGFEFVIIGPGLLTRATCDPAFEVRRKTDVFQGLLLYLDSAFGSFLRSDKRCIRNNGAVG